MNLKEGVLNFIEYIKYKKIAIYNEASIQYELAIFLRKRIKNYKIQLERNVCAFGLNKNEFKKKEIDVAIFRGDSPKNAIEKYAIEIKFPINGENPAQMFGFCWDISLLEELKLHGFRSNLFIAFTNDHCFWEGREKEGIYKPFRQSGKLMKGKTYRGPFSTRWVKFKKTYSVKWLDAFKDDDGYPIKFFIVEV